MSVAMVLMDAAATAHTAFVQAQADVWVCICWLACSELRGRLHAYDEHLNMVLGDVEETTTTMERDEETDEDFVKKSTRKMEMLFLRGDVVVLVAPPLRTS